MSNIPKRWIKKDNTLVIDFELSDFKHALATLNSIGEIAEKLNHHPDLLLHEYNKLTITTTTHSANVLTEKDYELAQSIVDLLECHDNKERLIKPRKTR